MKQFVSIIQTGTVHWEVKTIVDQNVNIINLTIKNGGKMLKYRACVYDRKNPSFWKYTKLYKTKSDAFNAGHRLACKNKVELADILITEYKTEGNN